jgi:hypothetical protein
MFQTRERKQADSLLRIPNFNGSWESPRPVEVLDTLTGRDRFTI